MKLFAEVEDEGIREIMASVVLLEAKHRSAGAKNFPRQAVRDVVDSTARLEEMRRDTAGDSSHAY